MTDHAYTIHIVDKDEISMGVDGEWPTDAEALNWAHFWLGRYRADVARLYRSIDAAGNPADLVAEIRPPAWLAERDSAYAQAAGDKMVNGERR